jgi:DNA end-binding protein Ku
MEYARVAPRAYWKGYLRLSLVSCPIQLFPATSEREKIRFHQINKKTGNRIKYCKIDAVTGEQVNDEDIVMGYEISKGHYIEITKDELDAVATEGTHTIDIDQFVPRKEIDDLYLNNPYYVTPDGEVGRQAYVVIREAIRQEGMVALGRVVFTTREHVIALEPRGKGLLGVTLRYPYEIRNEADYFGDLPDEKVTKEMLDLAVHIVRTKAGHFHPEKFEDHYERALKELIRNRQRGEKIEKPSAPAAGKVIDLMEALRQSATRERGATRRREERGQRAAARHRLRSGNRSSARARKVS